MSVYTNTIQTMYITYFNRPADVAGLANWEAFVAGMTAEEAEAALMAEFEGSAEYAIVFDGMSAADIATATTANATNIDNKVTAATAFTAAAGATYSGVDANAAASAWLASVDGTDASLTAALATVDAVIAALDPVDPVDPTDPTDPTDSDAREVMTVGQDIIETGSGDDTISAYVFNNSNTLQSGDMIDAGAGEDTLNAQVGNSNAFAISAITDGVENVFFNARSDVRDSNDNNLLNNFVQIDAADMMNVQQWGTDGSRADVVIEDIRIADYEITSDITFTMRDTDAGSAATGADGVIANDTQVGASLHTYFDANSLRNTTTSSDGIMVLEMIDGVSMDPANPAYDSTQMLKTHYQDTFVFKIDGQLFTLHSEALGLVRTYDAMEAELQSLIDAQGLDVTVSQGGPFTVTNLAGNMLTGVTIVFQGPGEIVAERWESVSADQPTQLNMIYDTDDTPTVDSTLLVTSEVIVDNVGRGSEGGDLEIGTMSTRGGVQQFEVNVEDSSWLSGMRSTNEALQVVNIMTSPVAAGTVGANGFVTDGDLVVGTGMTGNNDLQGLRNAGMHVNTDGLIDVRTVSATGFVNDLYLGASLTNNSLAKYLHPIESDTSGVTTDDLAFTYTMGSGNDRLNLAVSGNLLADSDFSLSVSGAGGDDMIQVAVDALTVAEELAHSSLANVSISGGDGDDTVTMPGTGDVIVTTGAGNDTVYADNSGSFMDQAYPIAALEAALVVAQANLTTAQTANGTSYGVLNAAQNAVAAAQAALDMVSLTTDIKDVSGDGAVYTSNNLAADNWLMTQDTVATMTFGGIKGQLQVNFRGVTSDSTDVQSDSGTSAWTNIGYNSTTYSTSAYDIRQALKDAVNNDPELSKLIVVKDGPQATYVIESLVDGAQVITDLSIDFRAPLAYSLANQPADGSQETTAAEEAAAVTAGWANAQFTDAIAAAAYGGAPATVAATATTASTSVGGSTTFALDDNGALITGAASLLESDNTINLGTGIHDVVVLGTGPASNDTVIFTGYANGYDTILNLDSTGGPGHDLLDFTAYGVTAPAAAGVAGLGFGAGGGGSTPITDDWVYFGSAVGVATVSGDIWTGPAAAAADAILIEVNTTDANVADVYHINSTAASAATTIQLIGTIDLADLGVAVTLNATTDFV